MIYYPVLSYLLDFLGNQKKSPKISLEAYGSIKKDF